MSTVDDASSRETIRWLVAVAAAWALACTAEGTSGRDRISIGDVPGTPAVSGIAGVGTGDVSSVPTGDGFGGGSGAPAIGRASIGSTPLPCELDAVLATSCRGCHARDPGLQAPMALVTHEDLMWPAVSDPTRAVHELVSERVHSAVAPMPPLDRARPLLAAELGTIDGWIAGGVVAGAENCGASASLDTTGITYAPPAPEEIESCHRFVSHQNSVPGDTTPYPGRSGEYYACFYFDVPWDGEKQAVSFRSVDSSITHHWLLYDTSEPLPDGTVQECLGTHFGAPNLLAAWAVNQQREQFMPQEVGLKLPVKGSGRKFLLEVHFFNPGAPQPGESGVEVCLGREPRPNTATVSWLGSEAISLTPGQKADIAGTCTPPGPQDIHIFRSFPHMHAQGVHLDTVIHRTDGSSETLVDESFDFNNQLMFDTPAVIHPGDRLVTTCHYENKSDRFIRIGYDSLSEMCFNFVYAWPANTLVNGVSLTGASTPCLL